MVSSPRLICDREQTAVYFSKHPLHGAHGAMSPDDWSRLADQMAEDARYFDSFYGWHTGRETIRQFLSRSMTGLQDWRFPVEWTEVGEGRVVVGLRNQLPGHHPDRPIEFLSVSVIEYRADGSIVRQMDNYDRLQAVRTFASSKLNGLRGQLLRWF